MKYSKLRVKVTFLAVLSCLLLMQCVANPISSSMQYATIADEAEKPWAQAYPYVVSFDDCSIVETDDNGYLIACSSDDTVPTKGMLIRIDSSGNVLWQQYFGLESNVKVSRIIKCQDGGFATVGRSYSEGHNGAGYLWSSRLAENGTVLWQHEYTSCSGGTDIKESQNGGFILTGSEPDIIRIDADGIILWTHTSSWYRCHAKSVVECENGDFVITGQMALADSYYDAFLIRLNESGSMQWSQTYNYASLDGGNDIIQCTDGGFAIAGVSGSWNYYPRGFWLLRTTSNGTVLFENTYCAGFAQSVVSCTDGGFAIVGTYTPSEVYSEWDAVFVRTDVDGNEMWNSSCVSSEEARANCIVYNSINGYAISGWTQWETETFSPYLPFVWRLDDVASDNVTISLYDSLPITNVTTTTNITTTTDVTTTTDIPTTTDITTTTDSTTTIAITSVIIITTGNTSITNSTPSYNPDLVSFVSISSGVIIIVITIVILRSSRPSN